MFVKTLPAATLLGAHQLSIQTGSLGDHLVVNC